MKSLFHLLAIVLGTLMSACGTLPTAEPRHATAAEDRGNDVVVFSLGLVETDYQFGGKNPDTGLDCSGMVSYVFSKAAGMKLTGSAADMAHKGRAIALSQLKPGDLVFFNVANRSHSHVGIYIGDQRFVHAPSRNGKVRTDRLDEGWFASRFEEARTYFE